MLQERLYVDGIGEPLGNHRGGRDVLNNRLTSGLRIFGEAQRIDRYHFLKLP